MKRALKSLLQKLEEIENEHDGLGDTNVRDHMSEHVRRAFLRPEIGFEPDGEYGLDPEANRKVSAALTAFCKAAEAAAQRLGLTTFAQRVAGEGADDPYLESRPEPGSRVRVREGLEAMDADGEVSPPEQGFMALLEAEPERIDKFDATFRRILDEAAAKNVAEKSSYWW